VAVGDENELAYGGGDEGALSEWVDMAGVGYCLFGCVRGGDEVMGDDSRVYPVLDVLLTGWSSVIPVSRRSSYREVLVAVIVWWRFVMIELCSGITQFSLGTENSSWRDLPTDI